MGNSGGPCGLVTASNSFAGDGSVMFTLTRSGMYSVVLLLSTQNFDGQGTSIGESPYTIECLPQNAGAPGWLSATPTSAEAIAGISVSVSGTEFDAFGNLRAPEPSPWRPKFSLRATEAKYAADPALTLISSLVSPGSWSVELLATRAGVYRLLVEANGTAPLTVVPSNFILLTVRPGEMRARGTSDSRSTAYVAYTDEMSSDNRPTLTVATNRFDIEAGDAYGNAISSFDPSFSTIGMSSRFSLKISSEARNYLAFVSVADPVAGRFQVSFTSTIAGWFNVEIKYDDEHIQKSPSSLYVNSGVASGVLSYPCIHEGTGCYDGVRSDPLIPTCSRLINDFDGLFCSTASDSRAILSYVRIRDRWGNDRGERHWEDFVRYNVSYFDYQNESVLAFLDEGCLSGTLSSGCGPSSNTQKAVNIDSGGLIIPSNEESRIARNTFLYVISFVGTRSGTYRVDLAHVVMLDRISKVVKDGISNVSSYSAYVLPDEPHPLRSRIRGWGQASSGSTSNFSIATWDRFNNSRVVSRDALSLGQEKFFILSRQHVQSLI
jgi:hypothetical protein